MIRPEPARWFEVLAGRDDAARVLEAVAGTGAVELDAKPTAVLPVSLADLRPMLQKYAQLAQRYRSYWPAAARTESTVPEPPADTLSHCLTRIGAWASEAEPSILQLQRNQAERAELILWRRVLGALAASNLDFGDLARAGPLINVRLLVFPREVEPTIPEALPVRPFIIDNALHVLVVGSTEDLDPVVQQALALKARAYPVPTWLQTDAATSSAYAAARLSALDQQDAEHKARLHELDARHALPAALGEADGLQWVIDSVHALEADDLFCWITGWTSDVSGHRLREVIDRSGARAVIHFPSCPLSVKPPLVLANPAWARPFEIFSRALGMPARDEADPTQLLALVVPIMFGYMFGDVGQGLVIAAAGFVLRKRWPLARLFVSGGITAACFGLLFGSVFSLPGILHPLWVEPLADPLSVLLVPLYGGAVLLTVGLLLTALEAHWRRELRGWFCSEVWLMVAYVAILGGVLAPEAFVIAAVAAALFCLGRALSARRLPAAFAAIAELVERTLQIVINTLSFARIGAFALAHAGLSSAIVALMAACGTPLSKALVLIVGNAIVLVLEGLVVSIQTTRLVLFEFFTRFLVAQGRVFRPLPPPPSLLQERS